MKKFKTWSGGAQLALYSGTVAVASFSVLWICGPEGLHLPDSSVVWTCVKWTLVASMILGTVLSVAGFMARPYTIKAETK